MYGVIYQAMVIPYVKLAQRGVRGVALTIFDTGVRRC
jgi:hypothetical protein